MKRSNRHLFSAGKKKYQVFFDIPYVEATIVFATGCGVGFAVIAKERWLIFKVDLSCEMSLLQGRQG